MGMTQSKPEKLLAEQKSAIDDSDHLDTELKETLKTVGNALWEGLRHPSIDERGETIACSGSTVATYLQRLRIDMGHGDFDIREVSADEFNQIMAKLDQNRSTTTTGQTQSAAKWFFKVTDRLDTEKSYEVDPRDIKTFSPTKKEKQERKVDPSDIPDTDDIDKLRKTCGVVSYSVQLRALIETLTHTGQRIGAILPLQIKHVNVDEKPGHFEFNIKEGGLKGAEKRGKTRPLLGAHPYMRQWLSVHPYNDDPEAYVFIGDTSHRSYERGKHWSNAGVRNALNKLERESGIDIDLTPHSFRHHWVTHMKWERGLDWPEIKQMGGWAKKSNTPEKTYSHVADSKLAERLEEKLGYAESDGDDDFSRPFFLPENCNDCGEYLEPHWVQCPTCKTEYSMEMAEKNPEEKAKQDTFESKGQADDHTEKGVDIANKKLKDITADELRALAEMKESDD